MEASDLWEWLSSLLISLGLLIKWLAGIGLSALLGKMLDQHFDDEDPP